MGIEILLLLYTLGIMLNSVNTRGVVANRSALVPLFTPGTVQHGYDVQCKCGISQGAAVELACVVANTVEGKAIKTFKMKIV